MIITIIVTIIRMCAVFIAVTVVVAVAVCAGAGDDVAVLAFVVSTG